MIAWNVLQNGLKLLQAHSLLFIFSGLVSFLFTYLLIPLVISIAERYRILDEPDGKVKTHGRSVPYLGGLAVFAGFLASVIVIGFVDARISFLLLGCTLLMLLGLADDLRPLKPWIKFLGQMIVAFGFVRTGFYLKENFFLESWAIPVSAFWLLVCMNAINLIDVMDGLSSSVSLLAASGYLGIALLNGDTATAQVLILFMGSLLAFFYYNKPPARIYLGDAGSLFIGGFLGVIPFVLSWSDNVQWGFLLSPLPLAVPLMEIVSLMVIRTYKGIPFFMGSKDHFCHYLGRKGWRIHQILVCAAIITLGVNIICWFAYMGHMELPRVIALGCVFILGWALLLWPAL